MFFFFQSRVPCVKVVDISRFGIDMIARIERAVTVMNAAKLRSTEQKTDQIVRKSELAPFSGRETGTHNSMQTILIDSYLESTCEHETLIAQSTRLNGI